MNPIVFLAVGIALGVAGIGMLFLAAACLLGVPFSPIVKLELEEEGKNAVK